jgi:aminoglycoside 6'-N-acetyltransferase I
MIKIIKIDNESILKECSMLSTKVYNNAPWNDRWTDELSYERFLDYYKTPKFFGLIVYLNEILTGAVLGNVEKYFSGDYFFLKEMFVDNTKQRSGIGTELLSDLKILLAEKNINSIILFTAKNMFPYNFYKKSGFKDIDTMCMMDCKI